MRPIEYYEEKILAVIKKHNLFTNEMIFSFCSEVSRARFYQLKLNKFDTIKKALDDNKNRTKQSMLNKWYKSENATLQIALMKLIGSDDEVHKLNGTRTENVNTNTHKFNIIDLGNGTPLDETTSETK